LLGPPPARTEKFVRPKPFVVWASGAPAEAAAFAPEALRRASPKLERRRERRLGAPRANRGAHGADCAPWGMASGVRGGDAPGSNKEGEG